MNKIAKALSGASEPKGLSGMGDDANESDAEEGEEVTLAGQSVLDAIESKDASELGRALKAAFAALA